MEIINLTPHPLVIYMDGQPVLKVPSTGFARAEETREPLPALVSGDLVIPVTRVGYGAATGLPHPRAGVILVTSQLTAAAVKESGRDDIFIPGPAIRDTAGAIIGCDGLARL